MGECECGHGMGEHFIDYAGPGICGGVMTKCLEKGCGCLLYKQATTFYYAPRVYLVYPLEVIYPGTAGKP